MHSGKELWESLRYHRVPRYLPKRGTKLTEYDEDCIRLLKASELKSVCPSLSPGSLMAASDCAESTEFCERLPCMNSFTPIEHLGRMYHRRHKLCFLHGFFGITGEKGKVFVADVTIQRGDEFGKQ